MWEVAALSSILCIGYAYAGYPLLLALLGLRTREQRASSIEDALPSVVVVIPAHNEELVIERAVRSALGSDYPSDLLRVVVASDASTDRTDEIVRGFGESVALARAPRRCGKRAALCQAIRGMDVDVFVFADASSFLRPDAISILVHELGDPTVGSVVGSRGVLQSGGVVPRGDGLYWRYESRLRTLESALGSSCVGVEGGLFAIRSEVLQLDFRDDIAIDYAICCEVHRSGYTNRYAPSAKFDEFAAASVNDELRRKVRVIVRGIRGFFAYWFLLNPLRHPLFAFQNVSHRLFRWLVPIWLLLLLASTFSSNWLVLHFFFWCQAVFYALAAVGSTLRSESKVPWALSVPTYFATVNLAALVAWLLVFRRFGAWEPPRRASANREIGQ